MKSVSAIILSWLMLATGPLPALAQNTDPAQATGSSSSAGAEAPETSYHLMVLPMQYRFVGTSGYPGRVAEYDSLRQSFGGDLTFTWVDETRHNSLRSRSNFLNQDEYDSNNQLRLGQWLTFSVDSRSFVRHLDNVPFGTNLSPDDTLRSDSIPQGALFGIKRTQTKLDLRLKPAHLPVTFFVKGGFQSRRGHTQMQWYDMGGDATCGSCHSVSQFRTVNYTTRNVAGGFDLKVGHSTLTYEHSFRSFVDRLQNPLDPYGSTLSLPDDELPAGVPDTVEGLYAHNILPTHRTSSDTLRLRVPFHHTVTFNGSATDGRTRNVFTGNPQNYFNVDATLTGQVGEKISGVIDFHQQNTLNEFTPLYPLFANPSFHRQWLGVEIEYRASRGWNLEAHYRRTNVTRTNADLFPQFYSPDNLDVRRVIPNTFSNTAGFTASYRHGERWEARSGYEWVGTHAPGYVTDPGTAGRVFGTVTLTPIPRVSFTEDVSYLAQSKFPDIQRRNRLFLNTSYITLRPVADWSLAVGYAYYQNNLRTDLIYGTDPFYQESLVPFKSLSQSYTVSSTYIFKKKLAWQVDGGHVASTSDLRPSSAANDFFPIVLWASEFSRVSVPQASLSSSLDYRFAAGTNAGFRFQYGSYIDQVHSEQTGFLRTYSLFVGKSW
jgi:hypothetical protein